MNARTHEHKAARGGDPAVTRRHDLDWVRVAVVALLFVFHSARVFDPAEPFYVWSEDRSPLLRYAVIGLFSQWAMPLLFLVSGSATWYALGKRGARAYLTERVRRLLVPFLFGLLVTVPPQAYLARMDHAGPAGEYGPFLVRYFADWSDLSGYFGTFTPAHLWFIVFLLVYSVATLPLLLHLRSERGRLFVQRLSAVVARPAGLWAVGFMFVAVAALPDVAGKNPFLYLAYFVVGFLVVADLKPQLALARVAPAALVLAAVSYGLIVWVDAGGLRVVPGSVADTALHVVRHLGTWFWLMAILGFAYRHLNFSHPALARLNEASYPVYVLHQTVIVLVAYPVVRLGVPIGVQYLMVIALSLGLTWAAYVLLVRPWNAVRFLMGLGKLPSRPLVQTAGD